jgi:alpha-mannosidase
LAPRIDFEATIDWREIGSPEDGVPGLFIEFADDGDNSESRRFESPFGYVDRPAYEDHDVPTLRYASFGDGRLTIFQDCKYGHQLRGGSINPRIVRSSYDPDHAPEVARSTVRYSAYFHTTPPSPAELARLGMAFNHPMIVVAATLQNGDLQATQSFAEVATESVVLSTLKSAEDGSGLIVRLVNYADSEVEAVVRIRLEGISEFRLCDLMERPMGEGQPIKDGDFRVPIESRSFATIRLT